MRVAVTGTPGTGKTTAVDLVDTHLDVVHLNDVVHSEGFVAERDAERDTVVADLQALGEWLGDREDLLVESHLAHRFPMDRVAVLRCHPSTVAGRLRERGESPDAVRENADSEALDVVLAEAVEEHGRDAVYEITTDDRSPGEVAAEIEAVVAGDCEPAAGTVDYTDYLTATDEP